MAWRTTITTEEAARHGLRPIPHEDDGRVRRGTTVITNRYTFGTFIGVGPGDVAWVDWGYRRGGENWYYDYDYGDVELAATFDRRAYLDRPVTPNAQGVEVHKQGQLYHAPYRDSPPRTLRQLRHDQASHASYVRWDRRNARLSAQAKDWPEGMRARDTEHWVRSATYNRGAAQKLQRALALIAHGIYTESPRTNWTRGNP